MSPLTEPLTQPQHPAVPSCSPALCAARPAVHLAPPPCLHLSPCSASAQAALPQGCRELLSAHEQEPRDSSSSSQALTARSGSPDLGRFPLERAATHAPPCSQAGLQQGHRPGRAGGRRGEGLGQDGVRSHRAVCTPWLCRGLPGSTSTVGSAPHPAVPCGGLRPAARGGGETSGTLRAADGRSHMEPEPRALPWGRGRCRKQGARGTYLPWWPLRGTGRPGSWRRRAR